MIHAFLISATLPDGPHGRHRITVKSWVVAESFDAATAAYRAAHPDATIWNVTHQGELEIITPGVLESVGIGVCVVPRQPDPELERLRRIEGAARQLWMAYRGPGHGIWSIVRDKLFDLFEDEEIHHAD